jgi:neutral ceramidase
MTLRAGVGKQVITPQGSVPMAGYFSRQGPSVGVHDDLHARALILQRDGVTLVFCSIEICYLRAHEVGKIRAAAHARTGIAPEQIFVLTTHTHSGPDAYDDALWDRPFAEIVTDAIEAAYQSLQPARLGVGAGFLFGYNINRRWLDRPADPAVGVLRVETAGGQPLAVLGNYACHAVVLGADNRLISGDWPGYSSRLLESHFGGDFVALFCQGGAGDVNPLTETVRQRLAAGHPVGTIGEITSYYGAYSAQHAASWNIEDRLGGTFVECETLARAYNAEVLRVWAGITVKESPVLWSEVVQVDAALGPDEPPATGLTPAHESLLPGVQLDHIVMEIMFAGVDQTAIVGHPGETFSEDAVNFRRYCQQNGFAQGWLISYANGSYAYLPPENAFAEGGYEVDWPLRFGISRHLQTRIHQAGADVLARHRP